MNRKNVLSLLLCLALSAGLLCLPARAASVEGTEVVRMAMQYIGKVPYVWGGNTIDGDSPGADCTGFICAIFEKFGFDLWDNRTTLQNCGTVLGTDLDDAEPGDILWYSGHAAIYAGTENGTHMIVHETGGIHTDVIYAKASTVTNGFIGIIHLDGVTHAGGGHSTSSGSASSGSSSSSGGDVRFALTTDEKFASRVFYSDTNAYLVNRITKPAGTSVTHLGLYLSDANGNLIVRHIQPEYTVGDSLTSFHCWWDINEEIGITLEPATTYQYAFFGIFDGEEVTGPTFTFTTTGSASSRRHTVTFHPNGGTLSGGNTRETGSGTVFGSIAPIPEREGYDFAGWYTKASGGSLLSDSSFVTSDLDVYAHWTKAAPASFDISLYDGISGEFLQAVLVTSGETYAVLPTPEKAGYTFLGWFTRPDSGTEVTSSTTVRSADDRALYAHWEKNLLTAQLNTGSTAVRFPDVPQDSYFYLPVTWAVRNGIAGGTDTGTFAPDLICTRGQVVTFLYRAMGSPALSSSRNPFSDVSSRDFYHDAVLWAVEQGITSGTSETTFSPDAPCTRSQAVALLYKGLGSPAVQETARFQDVDPGSYYARAVAWAVSQGITSGTGETTFSPDDPCTRSQIVTFLYRAMA